MKRNFLLYTICAAFLLSVPTIQAQPLHDVIYPENRLPITCTILNTDEVKVNYKKTSNSEGTQFSLPMHEVLLLFQRNGNFMIPSVHTDKWIQGAHPDFHQIIMHQGQVLRAQHIEVQHDQVSYQNISGNSRNLSKDDIGIIIYKNGDHQMLGRVSEVVEILKDVAPSLHIQSQPSYITATISSQDQYVELTDEQLKYFRDKGLQKARDLGRYLNLISNKNETEDDKLYAINAALKLFINDASQVEVSSLNRKTKQQFHIREYLQRLRYLSYDNVELVWIKAQMVSRFRKGEDGKYYGIITAQQLFRGFLENEIAYQDVTEKNIEVVLDRYVIFDEGVKKQKWDVFLSDISVQQTRDK